MNKVPFQGKKLALLHGPAIEASRRKLQELRSKFHTDNVMVFEKGEDVGGILTNLQSVSLFGEERLIIIENPPDDLQSLILDSTSLMLILWFDHKVDIKEWPGFESLFFPESKEVSVFHFLDYLAAQDARAFLEAEKLKKQPCLPAGRVLMFIILLLWFFIF